MFPEPFDQVSGALIRLMRTSEYRPTPAAIRKEMYNRENSDKPDANEAWEIARKCWKALEDDSAQEAERLYATLPKDVQRALGSANTLTEYGFRMTTTELEQYEKPRFLKAYDTVLEQNRNDSLAIGLKSRVQLLSDSD